MRKTQYVKILEMLDTLREAHGEIKRMLSLERSKLDWLLADCHDFAVFIGEYIKGTGGEELQTVALLGTYRELLCKMGLEPNVELFRELDGGLREIINNAQSELKPDRIEVAFFPYSAAMADSLESIWRSALNDPNCDTYIVPIPYYEKKPDGSLGRLHYEGASYAKDLPITHWLQYDLKARHPDIAFIHNPYDEANSVSSVHPLFYSNRIKNFTDLLVYIPYFVCLDDVPEHFCVLPGTLHADKVILQSEKIRNTYIRLFRAFERRNNCSNIFGDPDSKFIALGSPKFDRVLSPTCDDYSVPDEWRELLERPDGLQKKVILYNTSLNAILQENEKYLAKLRSVLCFFQNRKDVVLWWRPHPLQAATYRSMRPQLLKEYKRIIEEYQCDKYGIYDDTPDLHRAIVMSDAYYGDPSSVVALYGLTGKPIMYQNTDLTSYRNGYDFTKVITHVLRRYEEEPSLRKLFYIMWEHEDQYLNSYVDYILYEERGKSHERFVIEQLKLFNMLSEGNAGPRIFNYCKKKVLL